MVQHYSVRWGGGGAGVRASVARVPRLPRLVLSAVAVLAVATAHVGERARAECRRYGEPMAECRRVLLGARGRVPADLQEFPHMVLIGFQASPQAPLQWSCGGSLISDSWVLTAAHCIHSQHGPAVRLLLGTAALELEEESDARQERAVARRLPHPAYRPPLKYNDIGLLMADEPVVLGRDVRIACLAVDPKITVREASATGFGKTDVENTAGSKLLMTVDLTLFSNKKCNEVLNIRGRSFPEGVLPTQLCAGDLSGGRDTCQGDSGGPLHYLPREPDCKQTFPLYTLLGVTSFGRFCGFKNSPGIYSRVAKYVDWIEDVVWPDAS